MWGGQINDAGLACLVDLPALHYLRLGEKFTDAGMAYLSKCSYLRILDLSHLPISDAGLRHLSNLHGIDKDLFLALTPPINILKIGAHKVVDDTIHFSKSDFYDLTKTNPKFHIREKDGRVFFYERGDGQVDSVSTLLRHKEFLKFLRKEF